MNKLSFRTAAVSAAVFFLLSICAISPADPRVIYGTDDRVEIYQVTDAAQNEAANAVGALIDVSRLTDNGNGTFSIQATVSADICPDQPFATQPMAAFGTCFAVGDNVVATAGAFLEFVDSGDTPLNSFRVVFGFEQTAANTTNLVIPAADIFTPTAIDYNGAYSVATLTVDRSMTTAQRKPLPVRRSGKIPNNTRVGIISYPAGSLAEDFSGIPEKIAFGNRTRVYDNTANDVFTANTDSFNHSDGSPVINQDTMQVEGILFNGDRDFYQDGACLNVNTVPDSAALEQVLRTDFIKSDLPAIVDVFFTNRFLRCGGTAEVHVYNEGVSTATVTATITTFLSEDSETVTLTHGTGDSDYKTTLNIQSTAGAATDNDGILQVNPTDAVTLTYVFNAVTYQDNVTMDCVAPTASITNQSVTHDGVTFDFSSNEPSSFSVRGGLTCSSNILFSVDGVGTTGGGVVTGLAPCTRYFLKATATDLAGNETPIPAENCVEVTTLRQEKTYEEDFFVALGWTNVASPTGNSENNWGVRISNFATSGQTVYSYEPGAGVSSSSYLLSPILPAGDVLEFSHTFSFQERSDGGILEISTNNGQSWSDLGDFIIDGGYTRRLTKAASEATPNPLVGRLAWNGGTIGAMTKVRADISSFTGSQNRVRFIFAANNSVASDGWLIDDVTVYDLRDCTSTGWSLR